MSFVKNRIAESNEYYIKEYIRLLREDVEKNIHDEVLYKTMMQRLDNLEYYVFH